MNKEEKKSIETLKDLATTIYYGDMNFVESDDLKVILNLIEKQQKEIDEIDCRDCMLKLPDLPAGFEEVFGKGVRR